MRYLRLKRGGVARYARLVTEGRAVLLDAAPWRGGREVGGELDFVQSDLLAPVEPSKIVCIGKNYRLHIEEMGGEIPSAPTLFLKPPSALLDPGAAIELPPESARVEHEGELALVIGTRLRDATPDSAHEAIFGYTCANDVTARDLQRSDVQFTRAKSFDTFCPVGPWIETELSAESLGLQVRVGGAMRQDGNTLDLLWGITDLLRYVSSVMTLLPGDLLLTGTPAGVGPLVDGDEVEVTIEGIWSLTNPVRARSRPVG